jgi:hypothetical protein
MVFIELQTPPVTGASWARGSKMGPAVHFRVARFRPFTHCLLRAGLMPEFRGIIVGART